MCASRVRFVGLSMLTLINLKFEPPLSDFDGESDGSAIRRDLIVADANGRSQRQQLLSFFRRRPRRKVNHNPFLVKAAHKRDASPLGDALIGPARIQRSLQAAPHCRNAKNMSHSRTDAADKVIDCPSFAHAGRSIGLIGATSRKFSEFESLSKDCSCPPSCDKSNDIPVR